MSNDTDRNASGRGRETAAQQTEQAAGVGGEALEYETTRRGVLRGVGAFGAGLGLSGTRFADDDGWGWDWDWDWDWNVQPPDGGEDISLLVYNTWLIQGLELPEIDLGWFGSYDLGAIGNAPQLDQRANEIGRAIDRSEYDVVAFCENFKGEHRQAIEAQVSDLSNGVHGPPSTGIGVFNIPSLHSGLHTIAKGDSNIVDYDYRAYDARGDYIRDADYYANKGVLYTEIDVGPGNIDLFTTHVISGGGTGIDPSEDIPFADPDPPEKFKQRQIREMREFILDTQKSENVTIAAGDFNVNGEGSTTVDGQYLYDVLTSNMGAAGLYDAWDEHGGPIGTTYIKGGPPGGLDRGKIDPENPDYFEDHGERRDYPDVGDTRFDYFFVQEEQPSHSFEVEVESIRRRHFWREMVGALRFWVDYDDVPNYLSDHVALELNLTAY